MILVAFFAGYFTAAVIFTFLLRRVNRRWEAITVRLARVSDGWKYLHDSQHREIETVDEFLDDVLGQRRSRR